MKLLAAWRAKALRSLAHPVVQLVLAAMGA